MVGVGEAAALPLVLALGFATVLLVRSRAVRWWEAVVVGLFGFYLALTPAVFMVTDLVQWITARFTT